MTPARIQQYPRLFVFLIIGFSTFWCISSSSSSSFSSEFDCLSRSDYTPCSPLSLSLFLSFMFVLLIRFSNCSFTPPTSSIPLLEEFSIIQCIRAHPQFVCSAVHASEIKRAVVIVRVFCSLDCYRRGYMDGQKRRRRRTEGRKKGRFGDDKE